MKKILIIEDKSEIIDGMTDLLVEIGYDVLSSQFSREGIELARKSKPDLIISDIMMPGMSGFTVFENLRSFNETKDIPVIFLSADADQNQIEKGMKAGAKDYIIKPYKLTDFINRVKIVLGD
ncbi:MAG: response regulator [Bacteroidetes bacterium]|nr:response regulator [Bacteroidota bacterium]